MANCVVFAWSTTSTCRDGIEQNGIAMNDIDESYMREALRIAEYARGHTAPNPLVGAVIVRDGTIIANGWHRAAGEPHAGREV